jgi:hypothetical protein
MDEFMQVGGESKKEIQAPTQRSSSTKRVHFSTQNSMVQVPRNPTPQSDDTKNSTYEHIQSIYSNEYEFIGGSESSNTNYYVDVDAKEDDYEKRKSSTPPKLPPKPSGLISKFVLERKQRMLTSQQKPPILKQRKHSDYESNESEPDYCSIPEIQEEVKSIKIVTSAEIHQTTDKNEYSEIIEDLEITDKKESDFEESFANVPKLPNVQEIIPPPTPRKLKDSPVKCIGQDNYITKSPYNKKSVVKKINLENKDDKIANGILAEINNVKSPTILKKQQKPAFQNSDQISPNKIAQTQQNIITEDLQVEFDWYNLDAEYKSDMVKEMDYNENLNGIGDEDDNPKIEYNLDFEYDSNPEPSEILEIEKDNGFTTVIKINDDANIKDGTQENNLNNNCDQSPVRNGSRSGSVISHFIELAETPKMDIHHKRRLNYEKFLSESGLSTKPIILPRRNHRMFYAGPFV